MTQITSDFRLDVERDDGCVVTVRLQGELDLGTADVLRSCLAELYASGRRQVVLDLSELDVIDSTGLGVLVAGLKRFRADDGQLAVVHPAPRVRKVFELTKLDTEFLIV
jgi:anti-sigma B factor antagonist